MEIKVVFSEEEKKLYSTISQRDYPTALTMIQQNKQLLESRSEKNLRLLSFVVEQTASQEDTSFIKSLLEIGATDSENPNDESALHIACRHSNQAIVQLLLTKSPNIHLRNKDGDTPLHIACSRKDLSIVKLLIAQGANIWERSGKDYLPIHNAIHEGHQQIVDCLLVRDPKLLEAKCSGESCLFFAVSMGHLEIAKKLVSLGADYDYSRIEGYNTTLLQTACCCPHATLELLRFVYDLAPGYLDYFADLGDNPLHLAIVCDPHYERTKVIDFLLDQGADIHAKAVYFPYKGNTPFLAAAYHHRYANIKQLLERGANYNDYNSDGKMAVHLAIDTFRPDKEQDFFKTIDALKKHGVDLFACTREGVPMEKYLYNNKHCDRILQLLNKGNRTRLCYYNPWFTQTIQSPSPKEIKFRNEEKSDDKNYLKVFENFEEELKQRKVIEKTYAEELIKIKEEHELYYQELQNKLIESDTRETVAHLKTEMSSQKIVVEKLQHYQEILLEAHRFREQQRQRVIVVESNPNLKAYYRTIRYCLERCFISCMAAAGEYTSGSTGVLNYATQGLELFCDISDIVPIIGAIVKLCLKWSVGKTIDKIDEKRQLNKVKNISEVLTLAELEKVTSEVALQLTEWYAPIISNLPTLEQISEIQKKKGNTSVAEKIKLVGHSFTDKAKGKVLYSKKKSSAVKLAEFVVLLALAAIEEAANSAENKLGEGANLAQAIVKLVTTSTKPTGREEIIQKIRNFMDSKVYGFKNNELVPWSIPDVYYESGIEDSQGQKYGFQTAFEYGFCKGTAEAARLRKLPLLRDRITHSNDSILLHSFTSSSSRAQLSELKHETSAMKVQVEANGLYSREHIELLQKQIHALEQKVGSIEKNLQKYIEEQVNQQLEEKLIKFLEEPQTTVSSYPGK